jgi:ankyrin repeat protein
MNQLKKLLNEIGNTATFDCKKIKNINQRNIFGDIPIHVACRWGEAESVLLLIANGSEINVAGDFGNTPLTHAVTLKYIAIIKIFLDAGADPFIKNLLGLDSVYYAKQHLSKEDFDLLFSKYI